MYLQSIKSVKQNAAKSVNRSTERKANIQGLMSLQFIRPWSGYFIKQQDIQEQVVKTEKVGRIRLLLSLHPSIRLALIRKNIKIQEQEFLVGRRLGMSPSLLIYRAHSQSQREFSSKNVDKKKQAETRIHAEKTRKKASQ